MILEKNINALMSKLDLFFVKIPCLRSHNGKYLKGEPFDYIVIKEGTTYCFDAKECHQKTLYESQIKLDQFNEMLKAEKHGAKVFFMIYFVKNKTIKFVHPQTILDNKKANIDSKEVNNDLKKTFLKYFRF